MRRLTFTVAAVVILNGIGLGLKLWEWFIRCDEMRAEHERSYVG